MRKSASKWKNSRNSGDFVRAPTISKLPARIQANLKVILTSAYSWDWVQDSVGNQQPWFYIRKPYHFSELSGLIQDVVRAT
jgi:hypothetical protein